MTDKRLIGTWKSDTRKTMGDIRNLRHIPEHTAERLKKLFGKLIIRYTRTRMYTEFKGEKTVVAYRVRAKDDDSVVIQSPPGPTAEGNIYHIHFEGDYYYLYLHGFREFFKKIE